MRVRSLINARGGLGLIGGRLIRAWGAVFGLAFGAVVGALLAVSKVVKLIGAWLAVFGLVGGWVLVVAFVGGALLIAWVFSLIKRLIMKVRSLINARELTKTISSKLIVFVFIGNVFLILGLIIGWAVAVGLAEQVYKLLGGVLFVIGLVANAFLAVRLAEKLKGFTQNE